jgi:hypothetical protein
MAIVVSALDIVLTLIAVCISMCIIYSALDVDKDKIKAISEYKMGYNDYPNDSYIREIYGTTNSNYPTPYPRPNLSSEPTLLYAYGWCSARNDADKAKLSVLDGEIKKKSGERYG